MSTWGNQLKLSVFGESHGPAIGVVIDGLPAGEAIDLDVLAAFCQRRAPGNSSTSTKRRETDALQILSGLYHAKTTGTPLCITIQNSNTHSQDYAALQGIARPGHADYTGFVRYHGAGDPRGGGHFSGRITAPLVAAGGIAKQILSRRGVEIGAHILQIYTIFDQPFDPISQDSQTILSPGAKQFPVLDDMAGAKMVHCIEEAAARSNSLGGVVECCAIGFPAGIGNPMFDGLENVLSSLLFGIPAVKGVEFGAGFDVAGMMGSENNDPFCLSPDGKIVTSTNYHGGILGGISSGMPICMRVAFKPTPSIAHAQQTVDFVTRSETELSVTGRHDPCVVPRAVPCVEAAVAFALLSMLI